MTCLKFTRCCRSRAVASVRVCFVIRGICHKHTAGYDVDGTPKKCPPIFPLTTVGLHCTASMCAVAKYMVVKNLLITYRRYQMVPNIYTCKHAHTCCRKPNMDMPAAPDRKNSKPAPTPPTANKRNCAHECTLILLVVAALCVYDVVYAVRRRRRRVRAIKPTFLTDDQPRSSAGSSNGHDDDDDQQRPPQAHTRDSAQHARRSSCVLLRVCVERCGHARASGNKLRPDCGQA